MTWGRWAALCAAVLSGASGTAAGQEGAAPVVLTGTVIENVSRVPIQGANVRLLDDQGNQRATSVADRQGHFRLSVPQPGHYRVRADRIGFVRGDNIPVLVGAEPPAAIVLTLTRNPVFLDSMVTAATREAAPRQTEQLIVGRLRDDDTKQAVEGATIELFDNTKRRVATKVTDQYGRFRMISPFPGRYSLTVQRPGYKPVRQDSIQLRIGDTIVVELRISRRVPILAPMLVTASAKPVAGRHDSWMMDELYERMRFYGKNPNATYITRDTIDEYDDRGFTLQQTIPRFLKRYPPHPQGKDCRPAMYVDGLPAAGVDSSLELSDVDFIEVYVSPSIPGSFAGLPGLNRPCMLIDLYRRPSWRLNKGKATKKGTDRQRQ